MNRSHVSNIKPQSSCKAISAKTFCRGEERPVQAVVTACPGPSTTSPRHEARELEEICTSSVYLVNCDVSYHLEICGLADWSRLCLDPAFTDEGCLAAALLHHVSMFMAAFVWEWHGQYLMEVYNSLMMREALDAIPPQMFAVAEGRMLAVW